MNVLVDTSIWSESLRRPTLSGDPAILKNLTELIGEARARIIGPIRQELLSGIRLPSQFEEVKSSLATFPDLVLETSDYEQAAAFHNLCRRVGIQGSNTDFLICSVASRRDFEIYTSDKDFTRFQEHLPIALYSARE